MHIIIGIIFIAVIIGLSWVFGGEIEEETHELMLYGYENDGCRCTIDTNTLFNFVDNTVYNYDTNKFHDIEGYEDELTFRAVMVMGRYCMEDIVPITKEQYEEMLKSDRVPCCGLGKGLPKIETGYIYDMHDVFLTEYYDKGYIIQSICPDEYKISKNDVHVIMPNKKFTKKACIKCKTCFDEKEHLLMHLRKHVSELNSLIDKYDEVNRICGVE